MTSEAPVPPAAEPASPAGGEAAPVRKPRLGTETWLEIRVSAELGQLRVSELARKYGVTPASISQHLRDHKIVWGSRAKELEAKAVEKVVEKAAEMSATFNEQRQDRIEKTREEYYKWHHDLDRIMMKKVYETVKGGGDLSDINPDAKALLNIKRTLMVGRRERFAVLDAEKVVDVNSLPDLIVRDLTEDEILTLQKGGDEFAEMDEVLADLDEAAKAATAGA